MLGGAFYKFSVVHFPSICLHSVGVWVQEGQHTDRVAAGVVQMLFRVFQIMGPSMLKTATVQ